jgi:lipid II:glycine glycyltransferase (peptidoglycan interpeptide bridge formation enzyme)
VTVRIRTIVSAEEWDPLVLEFATCDFRQSFGWGEARARQGWRPLRVAAFDGDECLVALAILGRPVPGLGSVLYAPRGPLIDVKNRPAWDALPALLDHVRRETGGVFLRVSPNVRGEPTDVLAHLQESGFTQLPDLWSVWNTPRNIMRLDVTDTESGLLARMARKRRQHISTASRKGVTAELATGREALRAFYAMLMEHATRDGYPIPGWSYLESLHAHFGEQDRLALIFGRVHDEIVSGAIGVRFGPVAHLIYAPSTPAARGTAVGDIVHWQWIRWARAAGCREIDFGSSCTDIPPTETHPNYGIYRFKVEIGARLTLYAGYHDYVFSPARYRIARRLERHLLPKARRWLARVQVGLLPARRPVPSAPCQPAAA